MKHRSIRPWGCLFALLFAGCLLCSCGVSSSTGGTKSIQGGAEQSETEAPAQTSDTTGETTLPETTAAAETTLADTTTAQTDAPQGENGDGDVVTLTDDSGDFTYTGQVQWIGDEAHGYMQVPANYTRYQDVDVDGLVQYCNGPYNIITLQHFDGTSADDAANNVYYTLEQDASCEGVTGAQVNISQYSAKQIYCYYPESSQYLVTWLIPDPEDESSSYYIAMEFTEEESGMMACSSTFTTHHSETDTEGT